NSSLDKDGGADDQNGRDQAVMNAFDDEFFFPAEFIHGKRVASTVDLHDDGIKTSSIAALRPAFPADGGRNHVTGGRNHVKQWKNVFAQPDHFAAIHHVNIVRSGVDDFSDAGDGKRIGLAVGIDE